MLFHLLDDVVREYYDITQEELELLSEQLPEQELENVLEEALFQPEVPGQTVNQKLVNYTLNK